MEKKIIRQCGSMAAAVELILGIGVATAGPTIGGIEYERFGPGETLEAVFTVPDGGVTSGWFSGLVEVSVSGVGQSLGAELNDAFYVFTNMGQPTTPGNNGLWYQLAVAMQALQAFQPENDAMNLVVYDLDADAEVSPPYLPTYRADHLYHFVIGLGDVAAGPLHFGVADGIFADNTGTYTVSVYQLVPAPVAVDIDIKPGSYPNSVNLESKGVTPVAVLTTGDFDASTVDPQTVLFAGASPVQWALEDVDGDGGIDMILHFTTQKLNLDPSSTEATLTGKTRDGMDIEGADSVLIAKPKS